MRVLICPDAFSGTLTPGEAADAIAAGWSSEAPEHHVDRRPQADGTGFVDALDRALAGKRVTVATVDPLGRAVSAEILVVNDTAYVESAPACGPRLLADDERDPRITSSYGLGVLVAAALDLGVAEIVIGLGRSATNDAGAGLLAALGLTPVDADGRPLPPGGAALAACAGIEGGPPRRVRLIGATDADAPLTGIFGASAVDGPGRGASREDVLELDAALGHFASVLSDRLPTSPSDLAARPGAGAAGGLGAAVLALGGELRPAVALVGELTGLDAALDAADVVVTGKGDVDAMSLRGSVLAAVAGGCRDRGLPCLVLAGQASAGRRESAAAGVTDTYTLVDHFRGDLAAALAQPAAGLSALGARLARQYRT